MISLQERDKLFNQYKQVAERAARGFAAMVRGSSYEFDDIQQEAYIALLSFCQKDNFDVRDMEPCAYSHIRRKLNTFLNSKKDGILTSYQKKKGVRICSTESLVDILDNRAKTDVEFQMDIDTARNSLKGNDVIIFELFISGYTFKEIGERLNLTKQAIYARHTKIIKMVKKHLTK